MNIDPVVSEGCCLLLAQDSGEAVTLALQNLDLLVQRLNLLLDQGLFVPVAESDDLVKLLGWYALLLEHLLKLGGEAELHACNRCV